MVNLVSRNTEGKAGKCRRLGGLGIGIAMLAVIPMVALITTEAPAAAKGSHVHTVSADAYVIETSPSSTSISLNGTTRTTVLQSPPLPAGNYLVSGSATGVIPASTDTNDYAACYLDKSTTSASTPSRGSWGWNGDFSVHPQEVFLHVASGTRIALYCFENQSGASASIGSAVLEVTRYGTISVTESG